MLKADKRDKLKSPLSAISFAIFSRTKSKYILEEFFYRSE